MVGQKRIDFLKMVKRVMGGERSGGTENDKIGHIPKTNMMIMAKHAIL